MRKNDHFFLSFDCYLDFDVQRIDRTKRKKKTSLPLFPHFACTSTLLLREAISFDQLEVADKNDM